jgi:hypothetical protein
VRQCVEVGLVQGKHLSVDGSFVQANASKESRIPREQLGEAAQVRHTVRQYLQELEQQNPAEEPVHKQEQVSTTDPDSTYATKGGTPARLGYYDNYLIDNHSCVIVGVQATAARMSQETVAAQDMLTRFTQWQGRGPESVAADTTYGNGEFLHWLADRSITPYMRTRDSIHRKNSPFFGPERFTYQPESNSYRCPAGEQLNYGGRSMRNRTYAYIGTRKRCGACALKTQCTSGVFRFLAIHMDEPARQRARELANTPAFAQAQRQRKKVEALFAELKNQIGLRACVCAKSGYDPAKPMKSWRSAWRKLTRRAGLGGLRFHDLRHHCITRLAEAGVAEQALMAIAGHVSREMLEHYSHIRMQAKRDAVSMLERPAVSTETSGVSAAVN